jgi:hypothetical protein
MITLKDVGGVGRCATDIEQSKRQNQHTAKTNQIIFIFVPLQKMKNFV